MKTLFVALAWALLGAPAGAQEADRDPLGEIAGSGPVALVVDLSEREIHLLRGGESVRSYPVAVGKPGHPTPEGAFRVDRIIWNPRWVPPNSGWARGKSAKAPGEPGNPMGRVKMFFRAPDYYIHGTEAEASLGRAASHGCVRMRNADVVELARIVMEHGGERRSPGWFRRVMNRITRTEEVHLSQPVRITVRE